MEFLTPDEKKQLEEKLAKLVANRPVLSKRIAEARELGDLKENAEYHAAREEQGLEEAEIRQLTERLENSKVIEEGDTPDDVVFLGATVVLREIDTGDEDTYKLVGESSNNPMLDYVEVTATSPMGESLMKARVGETVKVDAPKGTVRFEVVEIL
jgi:transcription elongation factor GreA